MAKWEVGWLSTEMGTGWLSGRQGGLVGSRLAKKRDWVAEYGRLNVAK